ncbi:MAG: radical SAM protein, partial [Clostridia bacterium]|nr:radical SAM protein [Clostridia bacterium]
MNVNDLKRSQLEKLAEHRNALRLSPHLRWLFFELTDKCNLGCRHCGSRCTADGRTLSVEDIERTLGSLGSEKPMICLTGGEPLLQPDFFEIAARVSSMGFSWGMTTNGTLIDGEAAEKLREAGMSTVSVSLDGMEDSHDNLRRRKGAWKLALRGLRSLIGAGFEPQVTTVVHRDNINDLDPLYDLLCGIGIKSWRPINVEPIGRACEEGELLLKPEQFAALIGYIREKRFDPDCPMEV